MRILPSETRRGRDARAPRGFHAGETPAHPGGCSRVRDARAPFKFMGARASGAHASEDTPPMRRRAGTPARRPGLAVALRLGECVSYPRRRDAGETPALPGGVHVGGTPVRRSSSWVRAPLARMPARIRLQCAGGQNTRAPSGCSGRIAPGCARLRRACKRGCTSGAHVNRDTTAQPASLRRVNL